MSGRTPEQILAAFGDELRAARPRRRWWRFGFVGVLMGALVVPTAVATKPVWAPEPTAVRPPGAQTLQSATRMQYVAAGKGWRLARATCTFADGTSTVVVYLRTGGGGAGRRCDALPPGAASGPVMAPMMHIDPETHRTLLFGAVPPEVTRVQVQLHRSDATRTELQAISATEGVFVARIPQDARVLTTVGLTEAGAVRLRCDARSCEVTR